MVNQLKVRWEGAPKSVCVRSGFASHYFPPHKTIRMKLWRKDQRCVAAGSVWPMIQGGLDNFIIHVYPFTIRVAMVAM